MGLGFGDVVKMNVFLVGDPATGKMDFKGFMDAYTQFFGTPEQPNLPARSAVQVAGLASAGVLVEVEVVLAQKTAAKKKHS
jgi:enamine deaminase RidA (YjgF/YER057c/UK114 family)